MFDIGTRSPQISKISTEMLMQGNLEHVKEQLALQRLMQIKQQEQLDQQLQQIYKFNNFMMQQQIEGP